MANVPATVGKKDNVLTRTLKSLNRTKYLQMLLLPGLIYYIIFHYKPMYGIIIAFKDFSIKKGIMGSPWVGLKHFRDFFSYIEFQRVFVNTIILNVYTLIFAFPMPIIFAVLLNELDRKSVV